MSKNILVTGGTSGIGLAVAKRFAAEGHNLILLGSSSERKYSEAITAVQKSAEENGKQIFVQVHGINVANFSAVKMWFSALEKQGIKLDVLVHGAGVFFETPITDSDASSFESIMSINVNGMWNIVQAALPLLRKITEGEEGSHVVAISSICSFYSFATYSGYCASKAAVTALTRSLALELGPLGININAVEPGRVETNMHASLLDDPSQRGVLHEIAEGNPSKRAFSSPDDIANIVYFLASNSAKALHGSVIVADEGMSLGIMA